VQSGAREQLAEFRLSAAALTTEEVRSGFDVASAAFSCSDIADLSAVSDWAGKTVTAAEALVMAP